MSVYNNQEIKNEENQVSIPFPFLYLVNEFNLTIEIGNSFFKKTFNFTLNNTFKPGKNFSYVF